MSLNHSSTSRVQQYIQTTFQEPFWPLRCFPKSHTCKSMLSRHEQPLGLADRLQCTTLYEQHFSYLCHRFCKICSFQRRSHNYCNTFCPEDISDRWTRQYTYMYSHKMTEWKLRIVFIDLAADKQETWIWCERFEFDVSNLNLMWAIWIWCEQFEFDASNFSLIWVILVWCDSCRPL